jgi:hypothetical protein
VISVANQVTLNQAKAMVYAKKDAQDRNAQWNKKKAEKAQSFAVAVEPIKRSRRLTSNSRFDFAGGALLEVNYSRR